MPADSATAPVGAYLRRWWQSPLARKVLLAVVTLGLLAAVWVIFLPTPDHSTIIGAADAFGWWAPALAVAVYVVSVQFCAPTTALNATFGIAFGMVHGTLLAWGAGVLSALVGFYISRGIAACRRNATDATSSSADRPGPSAGQAGLSTDPGHLANQVGYGLDSAGHNPDHTEKGTPGNQARGNLALRAALRLLDDHPAATVAGIRGVGIAPFSPTNYTLGLTRVSWLRYAIGTGVGILPGVTANVAMGAYSTSPTSWQLWAGIAVTGAIFVIGARAAKQATAREVATTSILAVPPISSQTPHSASGPVLGAASAAPTSTESAPPPQESSSPGDARRR